VAAHTPEHEGIAAEATGTSRPAYKTLSFVFDFGHRIDRWSNQKTKEVSYGKNTV